MTYQRFCTNKLSRFYFKIFFSISFLLLFLANSYSQNNYLISLENGTQVNNNTLEFDVLIKSTGTSFILTSYQCAFTFNIQNNGGALTFTYLSGSSQLINVPSSGIGIQNTDGVNELTFGSMVGSDIITSAPKKVGRFRLKSSSAYTSSDFEFSWNFQGVINTILTGSDFFNITNQSYHTDLIVSIDNTPPALLNASANDAETVVLNFSEQISQTSANNISNYTVSNNINVTNAVLSSGGTSVTLTTLSHTLGLTYTVTVSNITDIAGNLISPSANSAQYVVEELQVLRINVKVFLQGPYSNGSMHKYLNTFGFISLNQPYNSSPWSYSGSESVESIPADIVDWILIELRSGTAGSTMLTKRAGFIKTDGSIVDLDGISKVRIDGVVSGDYYVVIRHLNHLAVMSAAKITLSANPALFDFTTAANKAYGSGAQTSLGGGKYGMYSGDGNGNGQVNNADANSVWKQQNGRMGYFTGDFDMNGGVNITDKNDKWKINSGKSSKVPN